MGQGDQVHRHQVGVIRTIPAEYSITSRSANGGNDRCWHETAVLGVPANVCSWGKSGRAADIAAMTESDPELT
jgi:hypothetical protein